MNSAIGLLFLVAGVFSSPAFQSLSLQGDGSYQFAYDTNEESGSHSRSESRSPGGLVVGKYSYQDPTGDLRVVNYQAGDFGYVAKGAVGVAGAPDSQFPAEPVEVSEEPKDTQDPSQMDDQQEDTPNSEEPSDNEDYPDDMKTSKPQVPVVDNPPEGFPIGFFDHGFLSPRRLPEPKDEEAPVDESKKDDTNKIKDTTADDKNKVDPAHAFLEYFPPLSPFTSFHPHTWSVPMSHAASNYHPHTSSVPMSHAASNYHPTYVYSYQVPQGHGYYYQY